MVKNPTLDDARFDQPVTLREAYHIMCRFVLDYHTRGDLSVLDLVPYAAVVRDGESSDPAAIDDFYDAAVRVLEGDVTSGRMSTNGP